ncbi:MAG: hypothetical protein IRZ05_20125 [Micromonosporaceae bacterium]|nr:hypothetical protein [Micromonosporaceae bacterium]
MAGPTLVAAYPVYANANNNATLETPSFTPAPGEVIVVKCATWDTNLSMGTPSGGGLTFTAAVIVAPGGFMSWCGIYVATVAGSPGPMTVSSTPNGSGWHSIVVERWADAQLATPPATGSGMGNGGTPSATLTTTGADSVVTWVSGDINSRSPATREYLNGAIEDGLQDGSAGVNAVAYYAYQAAPTEGLQTFGLSAPANQRWVIAGVEVKAAATSTVPVTMSGAGGRVAVRASAGVVAAAQAAPLAGRAGAAYVRASAGTVLGVRHALVSGVAGRVRARAGTGGVIAALVAPVASSAGTVRVHGATGAVTAAQAVQVFAPVGGLRVRASAGVVTAAQMVPLAGAAGALRLTASLGAVTAALAAAPVGAAGAVRVRPGSGAVTSAVSATLAARPGTVRLRPGAGAVLAVDQALLPGDAGVLRLRASAGVVTNATAITLTGRAGSLLLRGAAAGVQAVGVAAQAGTAGGIWIRGVAGALAGPVAVLQEGPAGCVRCAAGRGVVRAGAPGESAGVMRVANRPGAQITGRVRSGARAAGRARAGASMGGT